MSWSISRFPLLRVERTIIRLDFRKGVMSWPISRFPLLRVERTIIRANVYLKKLIELAYKPGSVENNHSSRSTIARRLKQPTRFQRGSRHMKPYLVLLRVEFTLQPTVTSGPVRSYRTLSPLPLKEAVFSLLHLSSAYAAQTLSGTLPFGARTFLPLAIFRPTSDCSASSGRILHLCDNDSQ